MEIKKIFIHGWSFSSDIWKDFKNLDNGVFLDLPFHGINRNFPEDNILSRFSSQIYDLIISSKEETVLIGWSVGATVSLLTALKKPENLKKLVLIGATPKFKDSSLGHSPAMIKAFMIALKMDFRDTVYNFRKLATGKEFRDIPLPEKEGSTKLLREFIELDLTDKLSQIEIPVVLIHGKKDKVVSYRGSVFIAEKMKNSSLVLTDGNHAPFLEKPQLIDNCFKT